MAAFMRLLWASSARNPTPPAKSDNDDIYPVHMLDDTKTLRNIVVTSTLRFNDVLDAEKLHDSLSQLLEIGDWRKVGGRLRLKDEGKLEIHVPRPFTAERPAVTYSHQAINLNIEEHPLAKTLPNATETPSIQPGPQAFRIFAARKDAPETLEDFICQDRDTPQLSLHVTSFDNATLVGLLWPHTLMDVMGQQALLRGWSLVLAGRDSEVPPLLGAREDAICEAVDLPVKEKDQEEFRLGQKRLRVAELQRQARGELPATDGEKPFIGEGDVLTAWAVRAVASSLPQPRPITVVHALNARFRLSSLIQASGVYVQNMAVAAFTFLSPDVATSLGPIALENRRHLMEQSTEAQVLAFLRELRSTPGSDPALVLCSESDAVLMPFTNWTKADFYKTADFSPALLRAGEAGPLRSNPPGTMVFHHAQSMRQGSTVRNVVVVLGKDHGDNYWLTGILLPQAWAKIEEDISRM
ncbi:hypothetical protein BU16DRAFT_599526 [Lophium mytilinum]|uniref:Uncharacterized protein n=1 Tax=Lophium mytilinum TaxID=390894 RepID=A0A6A6R9Q4_9PEZI|nr:hypothetical protein BU16DRAFT_599526 [Lophium mytilinum]